MTDAPDRHWPPPELTTTSLILRPIASGDAAAIQELFPTWDIVAFLNDRVPWPYPPDGAASFVTRVRADSDQWLWTIRLRAAPERLVGLIHLRIGHDDNRGFWLAPRWRGQGLMIEASDRVTDFWFGALDQMVLRVPKAVANAASRRISERCGMRIIGTEVRRYVSGEHLTEIWEITRDEWRAYRARTLDRPAGDQKSSDILP